jgi:hypothetical protein
MLPWEMGATKKPAQTSQGRYVQAVKSFIWTSHSKQTTNLKLQDIPLFWRVFCG